jgi:hypothetical protein
MSITMRTQHRARHGTIWDVLSDIDHLKNMLDLARIYVAAAGSDADLLRRQQALESTPRKPS